MGHANPFGNITGGDSVSVAKFAQQGSDIHKQLSELLRKSEKICTSIIASKFS